MENKPQTPYVKKSKKLEDARSSSWAFIILGTIGLLCILAVWMNLIPLNLALYSKILDTIVLGALFLLLIVVGFYYASRVKILEAEVKKEEKTTRQIIKQITDNFTLEDIDRMELKMPVKSEEDCSEDVPTDAFEETDFPEDTATDDTDADGFYEEESDTAFEPTEEFDEDSLGFEEDPFEEEEISATEAEENLYFERSLKLACLIRDNYPITDDAFIDYLVEEIYHTYIPEE